MGKSDLASFTAKTVADNIRKKRGPSLALNDVVEGDDTASDAANDYSPSEDDETSVSGAASDAPDTDSDAAAADPADFIKKNPSNMPGMLDGIESPTHQKVALALTALLPSLVGYAAGGLQGGSAGGEIGAKAIQEQQANDLRKQQYERDVAKEGRKLEYLAAKDQKKASEVESRFTRGETGKDGRAKVIAEGMAGRQANQQAFTKAQKDEDRSEQERKYGETATVPGYMLQDGKRPELPEVKDFRKLKSTVERINASAEDLKGMVAKYGTEIMPGPAKQEMQSKLRELQIGLKEYDNLGVLNGGDMKLLNDQIGDPTALTSKLTPNFAKSMIKVLDGIKKGSARGVDITAANLGYVPVGRQQAGGGGNDDKATTLTPEERQRIKDGLKAKGVTFE
jgi:hypothetical protein